MDEIDLGIIAQLQYDGRKPYTQIAEELGVTEATVRRRVNEMIRAGILQVVGIVEPFQLGIQAPAIIGVSVQPALLNQAAEQIAEFDEVSYLLMTSGGFDLLVEVMCRDMDDLARFISERLGQVPGVQRTETFLILHTYKLSYRWGAPQRMPSAGRPSE